MLEAKSNNVYGKIKLNKKKQQKKREEVLIVLRISVYSNGVKYCSVKLVFFFPPKMDYEIFIFCSEFEIAY